MNNDELNIDELLNVMHKLNNGRRKIKKIGSGNKYMCLGQPYLNTVILKYDTELKTNCINSNIHDYFVTDVVISLNLFYKYDHTILSTYMEAYGLNQSLYDTIDIMLVINKSVVILYTYWIRLIQRHWKNQILNNNKKRKELLIKRSVFLNRINSEIHDNYYTPQLPGLKGLLSMYNK